MGDDQVDSQKSKMTTDEHITSLFQQEYRQRRFDVAIVLGVMLLTVFLGGTFDIYEHWHDFAESHEDWELDEIALGFTSLAFMMIWYIRRRQKHAEKIKILALKSADEAIEANRAKSDFLALMSHDLRTPLNAIVGFSDTIKQQVFGPIGSERYSQYADDIHRSGLLLTDLINDILDLSKVEAGKLELATEDVDVGSVIDVSYRQLEAMAQSFGHDLSVSNPDTQILLAADRRVLIQIVNNLLSNAVKYTPKGGKISIASQLDDAGQVTIVVEDNGVGMSAEQIKHVLEPYEASDILLSRQYKSTGLGLFLCAKYMKEFGGCLELESVEKEGTKITLIFPPERSLSISS